MTQLPGGHQRIGHRYDLAGLDVRWGPGNGKAGQIVDLSVSGAGIVAPTDRRAAVGEVITIAIEGQPTEAIVRDIRPAERDGYQHYGVEFLDTPAELLAVLNRVVGRTSHQPDLEDVWNRAT